MSILNWLLAIFFYPLEILHDIWVYHVLKHNDPKDN